MTTEARFKTRLLFEWWDTCNGEEKQRISAVLDNYLAGELTPGRVLECLSGSPGRVLECLSGVDNFAIDRLRHAIDERIVGHETTLEENARNVIQIAVALGTDSKGRLNESVFALRADSAIFEYDHHNHRWSELPQVKRASEK